MDGRQPFDAIHEPSDMILSFGFLFTSSIVSLFVFLLGYWTYHADLLSMGCYNEEMRFTSGDRLWQTPAQQWANALLLFNDSMNSGFVRDCIAYMGIPDDQPAGVR